jgi:signal peptidase I
MFDTTLLSLAARPHQSAFDDVVGELLAAGVDVRFRTSGWSMQPTIREGERVTVVAVAPRDVREGNIVLYRASRRLFAHRVVAIGTTDSGTRVFTLRGDAALGCDAPVMPDQVIGRIVSVERNGRWRRLDTHGAAARVAARRLIGRVGAAARRVVLVSRGGPRRSNPGTRIRIPRRASAKAD